MGMESVPASNWYDFINHGQRITEIANVARSLSYTPAGGFSSWKHQLDASNFGLSTSFSIEHEATRAEWLNLRLGGQTISLAEVEYSQRKSFRLFDPRYQGNKHTFDSLTLSKQLAVMKIAAQVHMEFLHEGTPAEIADINGDMVDITDHKWNYAAGLEPLDYWDSGNPKATKASTKKHFVVPVLQPDELDAARKLSDFRIIYTEFAEKLKEVCKAHVNEPIYFQGSAGTGKSLMAQVLGAETGKKVVNRVTFTAKMDVAMTLGNKYPTSMWQHKETGEVIASAGIGEDMRNYEFLGIGLDWRDGIVTKMARAEGTGGMLVLDELPKAPPEFVNRLHEILEDEFPTMTIYENAEEQAPVNKDLWIIATGNPVGGGYFNNPLDKALLDRMRVFNIDKPVADEQQILEGLLPEKFFGETTEHLLRAAKTLRDNEETAISTRALIMVAKSILRGIGVVPAFQINFFNTLPKDRAERAESAVQTQFFEDWNKYGPASKLQY